MKTIAMAVLTVFVLSACGGSGGGSEPGPGGNRPPTVFAGNDRTIAVGSTVTLDGSLCSDSDGDSLAFDWRFVSRPPGSTCVLSDATAIRPDFQADEAGEYIIELEVNDGTATATDSVIINASTGQTGSDCSQLPAGSSMADAFVCAHNSVRENAQPVPSPPLPEMSWDFDLEQIARNYAQTCTWLHNPHRSDTYPGKVGENLYATTWPDSTPAAAVQSWADEALDYDYATNTCQGADGCGHYTQIVWRSTVKVGCARVFCPSMINLNFSDAHFYVCNYAPAGNYRYQKPY